MTGDANFPRGLENMKRAGLAVFIDTDEGLTGVSFGNPVARGLIHEKGKLLIGRDPRGVRGLWKRLVDSVFKGGNEGLVNDAISALDIALWDLKAKINGEPLWKTLGASTHRVKAYASGIDMPLSDEELRSFYERMAFLGIHMGKLKVGLDKERDLRRLGIMQEALEKSGKTPVLCVDSNEYWSPKQAIQHIRAFEEHYELFWCEEPARRWDYRGLRKVSQSVKAAVATGENLADIDDFMPLVANEAVDIVEIGSGTSGITGAMMVADLAYAFELPRRHDELPRPLHGSSSRGSTQPHSPRSGLREGRTGRGCNSRHTHRGRPHHTGRRSRQRHHLQRRSPRKIRGRNPLPTSPKRRPQQKRRRPLLRPTRRTLRTLRRIICESAEDGT